MIIHSSPSLKRGTGIDEFCGSRLVSFSGLFAFPSVSGPNFGEEDAKLFELLKRLSGRFVLLEQMVVQKRCLNYPQKSVYRAAIQNRGKAWSWDSEQ